MKYTVIKSIVYVLGVLWEPGMTAAQEVELTDSDIENLKDGQGNISRDSIKSWLNTHCGDFQSITDFSAEIELPGSTLEYSWDNEDHGYTYQDCMGYA